MNPFLNCTHLVELLSRDLECSLSSFIALPIFQKWEPYNEFVSFPPDVLISLYSQLSGFMLKASVGYTETEFEAGWPIQGQPISKIQKEISDKEFKPWVFQNI